MGLVFFHNYKKGQQASADSVVNRQSQSTQHLVLPDKIHSPKTAQQRNLRARSDKLDSLRDLKYIVLNNGANV